MHFKTLAALAATAALALGATACGGRRRERRRRCQARPTAVKPVA